MADCSDDTYVCSLTPASAEKAAKELNEDPVNRLGAVQTLREWILQQKHFKCPTDTNFLLRFLRTAKFSQLRARQILENFLQFKTDHPEWFQDIDFTDPELILAFKTGMIFSLPGTDRNDQQIIFAREGAPSVKLLAEKSKRHNLIKVSFGMLWYCLMDENVQVNGLTYMVDMTGMTMGHITAWGLHDAKETMRFQDSFPARFKALHYYNTGAIMEAMFDIMKPVMKQKLKDRIHVHGTNLEDLYEYFPKSLLPEEYLPDDYNGPKAGLMKDILNDLLKKLQEPATREKLLYETKGEWKIDKKLKDTELPNESFRKLNVD